MDREILKAYNQSNYEEEDAEGYFDNGGTDEEVFAEILKIKKGV